MLSIGKMVARSEDYYLRTVATGREEYYTGAGESPGYWLGEGSRLLGLDGEVGPADLRAVLAGVSPHGEILTKAGVDPARRVSGFDLTFSAPKSVSLLYGLSDRGVATTVRAAHADAVDQALGYLERHALRVRRDAQGLRQLGAEGLVAAAFVHRTSRAGDPQLHTHVLVANAVLGADGVWSAPDARLFYVHARTAGALYQTVLRAELGRALGVRFGPVSHGQAELDGVPRPVLRAFSTRRREIEEVLEATGERSRRSAEVAALVTRAAKDEGSVVSGLDLRRRWLARAAELGVDVSTHPRGPLGPLLGAEPWLPPVGAEVDPFLEHLLGPEGLTASTSAFERRDVVRALAEGLPRGAPAATVEALVERLLVRRDVLELAGVGRGGEVRHTTSELLAVERRLLETADRLRSGHRGRSGPQALDDAIHHFPLLSDEQRAMVRRLTTSGAGVDVVVGRAGAGKTLALAAARMAWQSAGFDVHGAALSARAARALHDGAGVESDTLARLLRNVATRSLRLHPSDVVVLDEAGMVGTRQLAQLVEETESAGAKLVLVGDPRQLPEIKAGGTFAALAERLGAFELTENRRQREHWERFALDALRNGRAEVALATFGRAGRVHVSPMLATAREEVISRWSSSPDRHGAVMLAVERAEVAALNEAARQTLRASGSLGPDILEAGARGYAVDDRVVCLRNDRRVGVLNGTVGTVARRVGRSLVIATDDGERSLPAVYLDDGHLGHAYAVTVHKAQGLTVERAFVLATPGLTQEAGYVALSRARAGTELFVSLEGPEDGGHDSRSPEPAEPLGEVRRRLATSRAKRLALSDLEAEATGDHGNGKGYPKQTAPAGRREGMATYRVEHGARGVGDAAMAAHAGLDRDPMRSEPGRATDASRRPGERARIAAAGVRASELDRERHVRDWGRGR